MKKSSGISQEAIKYFAMLTMLINHIGSIFMPEHSIESSLMKAIGYFTAVTMCYFLVEGYYHTSSKERYSRRLLIFAIVSQLPYMLAFSGESIITFHVFNMDIPFPGFSMIFTLWICFQLLITLEDSNIADRKAYAIGLVCITGLGDWPFLAPLFVWAFR
ncbi:MAG: conjugal transfer protein TraX, partial [Lachnospiraceae bacterium]|nr:conjugal transfer protein TraX [Candidatus Equihabitans merdae]